MKLLLLVGMFLISEKAYPENLKICSNEKITPVYNGLQYGDDEYKSDLINYLLLGEEYKEEAKSLMIQDYMNKYEEIEKIYEEVILSKKQQEIRDRIKVVKQFIEFTQGYKGAKFERQSLFETLVLLFESETDRSTHLGITPDYTQVLHYCVKLENKYPKFDKINIVYHIKAYCLENMGRRKEALRYHAKIVKANTKDSFYWESVLVLAESLYDVKKYKEAESYYLKLLSYSDLNNYSIALFRLGRIYEMRGHYNKAIKYFLKFLKYAFYAECNNFTWDYFRGKVEDRIVDLISRGIVTFKISREYLKNVDEDQLYRIYSKLAQKFVKDGNNEKAKMIFLTLLNRYPEHSKAPIIQNKIITLYKQDKNHLAAITAMDKAIILYEYGSDWREKNKQNIQLSVYVDGLIERYLLDLANFYYVKAKKTNDRSTAKKAEQHYQNYLSRFKKTTTVLMHEIFYRLGELYFLEKNYGKAEEFYEKAMQDNCLSHINETASYAKIKLYNLQYNESLNDKDKNKMNTDVTYKTSGKKNLPERANKVFHEISTYYRLSLNKEHECETNLISGEIYFRYNSYKEARDALKRAITYCKKPEEQIFSGKYIFYSYVYEKNWPKMRKWNAWLIGKGVKEDILYKKGEELVAADIFNMAVEFQDKKDFVSAIRLYNKLFSKHSKTVYGENAAYALGEIYESSGRTGKSVNLYQKFLKKYPNSNKKSDVIYRLAILYELNMAFDKAIPLFERLKTKNLDDEKNRKVVCSLKNIYARSGKYLKVIDNLKLCVREYAEDIAYIKQIAMLYKLAGRIDLAVEFFEGIIKTEQDLDKKAIILKEMYKAYDSLGKKKQCNNIEKQLQNILPNKLQTAEAIYYVMDAKFRSLDFLYEEYVNVKIGNNFQYTNKEIDVKKTLLKDIEHKYLELIQIGNAKYSVKALFQIGRAYTDLERQLKNARDIKGLQGEARLEYQKKIDKDLLLIRQSAASWLGRSFDLAMKAKVDHNLKEQVKKEYVKYHSVDEKKILLYEIKYRQDWNPNIDGNYF